MDPNVLSALIALVTIIGSAAAAFYGTKIAVARLEERTATLRKNVDDHEVRIRELEFGHSIDHVQR